MHRLQADNVADHGAATLPVRTFIAWFRLFSRYRMGANNAYNPAGDVIVPSP